MAQVKIPVEFLLQVVLLSDIDTKNSEPDFDSPLPDWLIKNKIDLEADIADGVAAQDKEKERAKQAAISKKAFESRDALFGVVFSFIREGAQVLKKYYVKQYALLADWGLPVTDSGRIAYPASFEERNAIAAAFFEKLASYGKDKNPLTAYLINNKVVVDDLVKNNKDAAAENVIANKAASAAENATEQRDLLWAAPLDHIHKIADYLKSINPTNPRALGDWGFVVDESVAVRKERKVKLIIGETKVVNSIKIGSIVTNMGKGNVLLYKGKEVKGAAVTLKPQDKMGMIKGYSTITLVNPSTLETGMIVIELPEDEN